MAEIRVLGSLEVVHGDVVQPIRAAKHRRLLAALVAADGRSRPVDALVEAVWGEAPPVSARKLLQVYVSALRRALPPGASVVTEFGGYRLSLEGARLDASRFEELAGESTAVAGENPSLSVSIAERALGLWRGPAYGDLAYEDFLGGEPGRLEELRLALIETRIASVLHLNRPEEVLAETTALAGSNPLRERAQALAMRALYQAGRQSEALEVYAVFRNRLDEELGLQPGPELRDLQRQILTHDPVLRHDSKSDRIPTGLPEAPNALVGRARELSLIDGLLRRQNVRLLVLTGAGGSGKTRLALEAARRAEGSFANGAVFVDLAPLREPGLVAGAIASAVGVVDAPGELTADALVATLRLSERLLVLDNAEHIRAAAQLFVDLLARAPRISLLVTSRAVLHVSGEYVFPVAPLELDDAAELFRQRARALRANATGGEAEADDRDIRAICRRIDGLPLAVELAAARTGTLTPAMLLGRLDERLGILTRGPRDLPARQQTLRGTIDWSVDLLSNEERRVLARLSVFSGGVPLEAAEVVCDTDLDALSTLVDHHLVQRVVHSGRPRLALLETIHEYATELLASDPADLRRTRHALAEWCRSLAEEAEPHLSQGAQSEWLDVLELEHENMRVALEYLREEDLQEQRLALAVLLSRFWYVRGYLTEGRRRLGDALERATLLPPSHRRRAFTAAASLALLQGDHAAAVRCAEDALAAAREAEEPRFVANALSNLGAIVLAAGDHARARSALEEAVARAREVGDQRITALAINNLGDLALTIGDYERARPLFEESLALLRSRGDAANIARSLFNIGAVDLMLGRTSAAADRFREGLALCRTTGDREDTAWSLLGLAATETERSAGGRGAVLLGAARAVLTHMGADFKPFERQLDELTEARSRVLLGDDRHEEWVARGALISIDEAVVLAIDGRPPIS